MRNRQKFVCLRLSHLLHVSAHLLDAIKHRLCMQGFDMYACWCSVLGTCTSNDWLAITCSGDTCDTDTKRRYDTFIDIQKVSTMQHQVAVTAHSILYFAILQQALHCIAFHDCFGCVSSFQTQPQLSISCVLCKHMTWTAHCSYAQT